MKALEDFKAQMMGFQRGAVKVAYDWMHHVGGVSLASVVDRGTEMEWLRLTAVREVIGPKERFTVQHDIETFWACICDCPPGRKHIHT